ncbi:MAG TPA: hypothetical protein VFQ61_17770 [Polyangiaceae bacterium]|nr:hypothetical protein [Polyangiaceae bacterium]
MIKVESHFAFLAGRTHLCAATLFSSIFLGAVSCESPRAHFSRAGGSIERVLPSNSQSVGQLEIVGSLASTEACPGAAKPSSELQSSGVLRFESLNAARPAALLADTPAPTQLAHYELPPGLYAINWVPKLAVDDDSPHQMLRVSDPAVINIFAGRVTRLEVERSTSDCDVLSMHDPETEIWAAARP